ncbi:hypothetical protein [Caldisericum sp.]
MLRLVLPQVVAKPLDVMRAKEKSAMTKKNAKMIVYITSRTK